jgi:DNA-binding winged helix-turn-helix (wHTH) protein
VQDEEFVFGSFRLDRRNALLRRGDERIPLTPKPFEVLCCLLERAGQLVTKDQLMAAVWPNLHVSESSLTVAVNALRSALGDDRTAPTYIETVTRRGYRFIGIVEALGISLVDRSATVAEPSAKDGDTARSAAWVGRIQELQTIARAAATARSGRRRAVFVTGEAGIGKTTLLEMALRTVDPRGVGIIRCSCNELFGLHEAFLPLVGGLSDVCQEARDPSVLSALRLHAPTWLAQMPWLLEDQDRKSIQQEVFGANRERMLREFCDFVEKIAAEHPWIIVLEDLHWSDPATVDAVSRLAHRERPSSLLILATYRETEVAAGSHPILSVHRDLRIKGRSIDVALGGLTSAEVAEHLAARFASNTLAKTLADRIFNRTEGQPLFVVALADHLVAQGALASTDDGWRLVDGGLWTRQPLPVDVREMILRKVSVLDSGERAVLDMASAAGPRPSALLLAGAMDADLLDVERICEGLARSAGALTATGVSAWPNGGVSGEYAFIHALYQQVLYEQLSPARRCDVHRRLGESLERGYGDRAGEAAPELATHFEQGRDHLRALRYLGLAAEGSARRFNMREAANYLTRALGILDALPTEAQIEARAQLLLQRAWAWRAGGDFAAALDDLKAMVACAAASGNLRAEVNGLVNLSRFQLYVDRTQCIDVAQRAVARSHFAEEPGLKAFAEGSLANLRLMLGPWRDDDAEASRVAIEAIDDAQDLSARARRCSLQMTLDLLSSNYDSCCGATAMGRELAQSLGDVYLYVIYAFVESIAMLYAGDWAKVRSLAMSALAISERNFNAQASALCRLTLAWLHVEAQEYETGAREAEAALTPSVEANPFTFFIGRLVLAKAYLGLGNVTSSFEQIESMARRVDEGVAMESPIVPNFYLVGCDCAFDAGDIVAAEREADRLHAWASPAPDRQFVAFALEAKARAAMARGEDRAARRHLGKAVRLVRQGAFPLPARRVYASASNFLEKCGRVQAATTFRNRFDEVNLALRKARKGGVFPENFAEQQIAEGRA